MHQNIKQILMELKEELDNNTVTVGDFNTPTIRKDCPDRKSTINIGAEPYFRTNVLSSHTQNILSNSIRIHIFFLMCTCNILQDRSYNRTQNKS